MESINTTKLDIHYYLFIGDILFITLNSFMSDDGVRLHVKASDVSVSSSLVFLVILYRTCVLAPPTV